MRTASILVAILLVLSSACAPGPNPLKKTADAEGETAGFLMGLWHGLIAPVTFVISVFSSRVGIYEVHNNGFWYNFGFVLGAGLFLSGGILGHRRRKRRD